MNLEENTLVMLSSEYAQKRMFALESIRNNKLSSPAIIEALKNAACDPEPDVSGYARNILQQLGVTVEQPQRVELERQNSMDTPPTLVANSVSGIQTTGARAVEPDPKSIGNRSSTDEPLPTNPTELLKEQVKLLRIINSNLEYLHTSQKQAEINLRNLQEMGASILRNRDAPRMVNVSDVNMQFSSMIFFMIKWAIASIPAAIILGIATLIILALFGGILRGLLSF